MKTFKSAFFFTIFTLFYFLTFSQTLEWAKSVGGFSVDYSRDLAFDNAGNTYTIGQFSGDLDFDPGAGTFTLSSPDLNNQDAYLLKLDTNGEFVWALDMGGNGDDWGYSVTVDQAQHIYATGYFEDTVDFDPQSGSTDLISNGQSDVFIQKLDTTGNLIWARSFGGPGIERVFSIKTDHQGNVYATGEFQFTVDFDPGTGVQNISSNGSYDIFILKLDSQGNFLWAKTMGGPAADEGNAIFIDKLGNVYTTGEFAGTVDFDPNAGTSQLISPGSSSNVFIQKLDSNGDFLWAKRVGDSDDNLGYDLDMDWKGNIYLTGAFSGTTDFSFGANTASLSATGERDIFVQKLDADGNLIWAKGMGGTNDDEGFAVKADYWENVYVTGYFNGTVDFDPGSGSFPLTAQGFRNIFLQKLDSLGNLVWANAFTGNGADFGSSLDLDDFGNIYLSGAYQGPIDVNFSTVTTVSPVGGAHDVLIMKIKSGDNNVGIEDLSVMELGIYPNPTNGILNIEFPENFRKGKLDIIDPAGRVVFQQGIDSGVKVIDVSGLVKGMYILSLKADSGNEFYGKFILNK